MKYVLDQLAKDVLNFSSQYGGLGSISYSAANLAGIPWKYPEYGDFCESYSPRTYGKWWKICPSATPIVNDGNLGEILSTDFVDLSYPTPCKPIRINIYEVFKPGSVIRIWAFIEEEEYWSMLWSGLPTVEPPKSRIFSPPLKQIDRETKLIRIEFDQSNQDYFVCYDAAVLIGIKELPSNEKFRHKTISLWLRHFNLFNAPINEQDVQDGATLITSKEFLKSFSKIFLNEKNENRERKESNEIFQNEHEENYIRRELTTYNRRLLRKRLKKISVNDGVVGGYFSTLPVELIIYILKQVCIKTLCRLACTSKFFNGHISNPLLYQHLNLRKYWPLVNDSTLKWLIPKCRKLKSLDLSWCGSYDTITSAWFMEFIQESECSGLTTLFLKNCNFVESYCLYFLINKCYNIQRLSLCGCRKIDQLGFGELKQLYDLTFLDLSMTGINYAMLQVLMQNMTGLKHLRLNYCNLDLDEVAVVLSTFNHQLISLGGWKCRGLTSKGFRALSKITTLQELDVGWSVAGLITDGLTELLKNCPELKKIFLSSLRTLYDQDLDLFCIYARNIEQLDITGTMYITAEAVENLLLCCSNLKLLDVHYCERIHMVHIQRWRESFPNVNIKGYEKQLIYVN